MPTFFTGWRRRTGVITLVLACLLMAFWLRSKFVFDWFILGSGTTVESKRGTLCLSIKDDNPGLREAPFWVTMAPHILGTQTFQWYWLGFGYFRAVDAPENAYGAWVQCPYWSIVLPLTLLSAWLLLSKPRKSPKTFNTL